MATISRGPVWDSHTQDQVTYGVSHLHPVVVPYVVPAVAPTPSKPGRAEIAATIRFSYSHHCFSQAVDKVPNPNPEHFYTCTARRETRVFCVDRWSESHALPAILGAIHLGSCFFTGKHNYFIVRHPTNPALGEYFVYFTVSRHASGFVDVFVESAYPRTDGERVNRRHKVSFNVLVVNALRGVPTHPPR